MNRERVLRTYDRWAPIYDLVFGAIFRQPRQAAIAAAEQVGHRILEVGVGTGLSLPFYSNGQSVVGIDISEAMLVQARNRVNALRLSYVEDLLVMDAQDLAFPDASFDVVTAQYVVNTVPDPERALDEFARVLKPGGELIVINRIGAQRGARLTIERAVQPLTQRLGWRADFPWSRFENWLAQTPSMRLVERRPMPPLKHFALIRFKKVEHHA